MKKNNENKREPEQNNVDNLEPPQNDEENMELRSPKVRTLLDGMPKSLTAVGFIAIAVILATLICVLTLIPYPYSNGESILFHIMHNV